MLEIVNVTRHAVALAPFTTVGGIDHAGVVIKGTWDIGASSITPSETPQPIAPSDVTQGESVRYAADLGWPKAATDVALVGHAYRHRSGPREVDVGLRVGPVKKVVRVFGDRCWTRAFGGWVISNARPFERMPLVWERAFGGYDRSHADARKHAWEARNPVGRGFVANAVRERVEGLMLPNIEDPRRLIGAVGDKPTPTCFGFTQGHWSPRSSFAGTYDDAWKSDRAPLLPENFDTRYFNAAVPDLIAPGYLAGGEEVALANLDENGMVRFRLPRAQLRVNAEVKGKAVPVEPKLDTVFIDMDARQLVLVWRGAIACPRSLLSIRVVFVKDEAS